MNTLANLTEKKLEKILINCKNLVQEKENLNVNELIEDIKKQVISSCKDS